MGSRARTCGAGDNALSNALRPGQSRTRTSGAENDAGYRSELAPLVLAHLVRSGGLGWYFASLLCGSLGCEAAARSGQRLATIPRTDGPTIR